MQRLGLYVGLLALTTASGGCSSDTASDESRAAAQGLTGGGLSATLSVTSDWGGGYCANVALSNVGTSAITAWTVGVNLAGGTLSSIWGGTATTSGTTMSVTSVEYNATLAAGASSSFGFCANGTARPTVSQVTANGSSSPSTGGTSSTGGTTALGGTTAKGGTTSTGGTTATGGTTSSGGAGVCGSSVATGHFQMENLDRGLVVARSGSNNYVGWRMLGYEYDITASNVTYNVYRNGTKIANVSNSTNYLDSGAASTASYTVSAVIKGTECAQSSAKTPWAGQVLDIPLSPPASGTTPSGETYTYNTGTTRTTTGNVSDGSVGDVDGDGQYEIIVKWDPSNAKDNANSGYTGPVYIDCYKLNGTRLWRMNLGQNIRAGAHYTQFLVYDFDGDGKAEIALKTAPGTKDGTGAYLSKGPAASDTDTTDYRNTSGYILSGPEYLTVFNGATGAELATVNFEVARGTVSSWGDSYGNRVDRFLSSVGFVSDTGTATTGSGRPAILMARGYYTRATVTAWTYRNGALTKLWTADSNNSGSSALKGQGAHSMAVADVDGDSAQEIIYGAAMIQSNGTFGCSTGYGHGDALHVGDFVPSRAGLEVFMPHEDTSKPTWDVRDAATCSVLQVSSVTGSDNGRGVAGDVLASSAGAEFWSAADKAYRSATTGAAVGGSGSSTNFLVWWDGDESRDLEDSTYINNGSGTRLLTCSNCMSNNTTKATPVLSADILGDWREEVIWRAPDSSLLRIYTTTAVTSRRIYTLMHDPQYRMQVSSEQTAYNQPPNPSFHIGSGMATPPKPSIYVK